MTPHEDLDLIDDPFRHCEVCDCQQHEDYGRSCSLCDIWICNNCWPEHECPVLRMPGPAEQG